MCTDLKLMSFYGLIWNMVNVKVMAKNLSEEELKGLKQMFKNIDTDRSGTITFEELKTGLSRLGSRLSEHEIKQLMDAVRAENLTYTLFSFHVFFVNTVEGL